MDSEGMKSMKVVPSTEREGTWSVSCSRSRLCLLFVSFLIAFVVGIVFGEEFEDKIPRISPSSFPNVSGVATETETGTKAPTRAPTAAPTVTAIKTTTVRIDGEEIQFKGELNFDVEAVAKEISKIDTLLDEYYGATALKKIREKAYGIPLTHPKSAEGLLYVARNMVRELLNGEKYVVGMIGSSVAAAHDNCHYDGYDRQVVRFLSPIWKAAGSDFEFRNAGEGGACGDNHRNQVYCIQHMVGNDIDLLTYSWTYFEGKTRGFVEHEKVLRWALMLDKSPATYLFSAGQGKKEDKHNCFADSNNQKLLQMYGSKYGFQAHCLEGALYQFEGYPGKKWGKVGYGMHNITRYGENDPNLSEERKTSLGVVWRNWHPGPLGFEVASDLFAHLHTSALKQALRFIASKSQEISRAPLFADFKEFSMPVMASSLPVPAFADPAEVTNDAPPGCLNLEKPTFGYHTVSIVPPTDDLSPYAGQIKGPDDGGWHLGFDNREAKKLVPKEEKYLPQCAHLDGCGYVRSQSSNTGWLVIKLPKMDVGRVLLCVMKPTSPDSFIKNDQLEVTFDGKVLDRSTFENYPKKSKCVMVLKSFPESVNDSGGHLYLGVRLLNETLDAANGVTLTHVIAL